MFLHMMSQILMLEVISVELPVQENNPNDKFDAFFLSINHYLKSFKIVYAYY